MTLAPDINIRTKPQQVITRANSQVGTNLLDALNHASKKINNI